MKTTYQHPACIIISTQCQLPLANSGYKVNGFSRTETEELGGDAPPSSGNNVKANPVDWNE